MKPFLAFLLAYLGGIASIAIPYGSLEAAPQWFPETLSVKRSQKLGLLDFDGSRGKASETALDDDLAEKRPLAGSFVAGYSFFKSKSVENEATTTALASLEFLNAMEAQVISVLDRSTTAVVYLEGGSGVIVSPEGHVLTASHVARTPGTQIQVRLSNGVSWVGITLASDRDTDSAIVKLMGERRWPFIPIGDSQAIQTGQWVLAMGYPLSFDSGRPAAVRLGRILQHSEKRLVSDCVIMGGDSGGPLVDLNGNLIGISSSIKKPLDENYFVPSRVFQKQWGDLLNDVDFDSNQASPLDRPPSFEFAQSGLDESDSRRNAKSIKDAFGVLNRRFSGSLVQVSDGTHSVAGTIVSADGLVVAKSSEVKRFDAEKPMTVLAATRTIRCRVVAARPASDLVLLELVDETDRPLQGNEIQAIAFPANAMQPAAGRVVFSLTESGDRPLGMVTVKNQAFVNSKLPTQTDLGLIVRQLNYVTLRDPNGIRSAHPAIAIDRVYPDSLADKAELKVGDLILTFDGQKIFHQRELAAIAGNSFAGQKFQLKVISNGKVEDRSIAIPHTEQPNIFERWGGGSFSKIRFGFESVICHDGIIEPRDCGGPLFDLQGNVIGINIARATRVSTFAVPLDIVESFVLEHRPNATLIRE